MHESGHTLASLLNKNSIPFHKVTILSKGGSLGHTSYLPKKDLFWRKYSDLNASLESALGGRAAEKLFIGDNEVSTGCSSDLEGVRQVVQDIVIKNGMLKGYLPI